MRKGILLAGLVLVLLMGVSSVWAAQDSSPEPGTPADNECNPGGVLYREENQDGCPTLWYWKAGWFLARFNRGFISRADFPKEFESVLPPLEKADENSNCWPVKTLPYSIRYIGPANTLGNALGYLTSSDCTGPETTYPNSAVVFADNLTEATTICATLGKVYIVESLVPYYPTAPANAYGCTIDSRT